MSSKRDFYHWILPNKKEARTGSKVINNMYDQLSESGQLMATQDGSNNFWSALFNKLSAA
jgi:hypothetical protein